MDCTKEEVSEDKIITTAESKSQKHTKKSDLDRSQSQSQNNNTSLKDKESYLTDNLNSFNYKQIKQNLPVKESQLQQTSIKRIKNKGDKSPFRSAKQIAIYCSGSEWGQNIFLYPDLDEHRHFKYVSTSYTESIEARYHMTTYLDKQKRVVFQIKMFSKTKKDKVGLCCWSYLSIYHHEIPKFYISNLMNGWSQLQITSYWMVRAYAIEVMLFRLQVVPFKPVNFTKYTIKVVNDQMTKKENENILKSFAEAGTWLRTPPHPDYRMAAHNLACRFDILDKQWEIDLHRDFYNDYSPKSSYQDDEIMDWYTTVVNLYTKYDYERIQLITSKKNSFYAKEKIIIRRNGAVINFRGKVIDSAAKYIEPFQRSDKLFIVPLGHPSPERQEEEDNWWDNEGNQEQEL